MKSKLIHQFNQSSYMIFIAIWMIVSPHLYAEQKQKNDSVYKSLVRVRISSIDYSYTNPWVRNSGGTYTVVGLVTQKKHILVLANDVRNAGLIEVSKHSSYRSTQAKVAYIDTEVNLALLQPDDPSFFNDLVPVEFGDDPSPATRVQAVKVDDVYRVYREEVQIMEVNPSVDFGFTYLPVLVLRTNEPFPAGGLLMKDKHVVGFIGYSDREKKIDSIPSSTLSAFLKRTLMKNYPGFVAHGYELSALVDPVLKSYYKVPENRSGALVTRVLPGTSAYECLKTGDVLLKVDSVPVDDRGYYDDPVLGKQPSSLLVTRTASGPRMPGSKLAVEVLRNGKSMSLTMELKPFSASAAERIRWMINGPSSFYMEGGYLFLELSLPYLRESFGTNWRPQALEFAYLFDNYRFHKKPSKDQFVILSTVMPDETNRGYERETPVVVSKVDGRPVTGLKFLKDQIDSMIRSGKRSASLELSSGDVLFLDLEKRDEINHRITQNYGIPQLYSDDLK